MLVTYLCVGCLVINSKPVMNACAHLWNCPHLETSVLIGDLALPSMALCDKATAFALAERAMALSPIEKDPLFGLSLRWH